VTATCGVCREPMTVVEPQQTAHPCCAPGEGDSTGTLRTLLTLSASGVAGEIVGGTTEESAAVRLGRRWGRTAGVGVLTQGSEHAAYTWPEQWADAVADVARRSATDAVDVQPLRPLGGAA
jgi:hypothetical protein